MNKIEEKAKEFADAYFPSTEYVDKYMLGKKAGYMRGFQQGAEWAKEHLTDGSKTMWHDLRKNPNDLPEQCIGILFVDRDGYTYKGYLRPNKKFASEKSNYPISDIIAWHELPQFNEEEKK